jgi:V/A-type H+-transporting ATPase subunit I
VAVLLIGHVLNIAINLLGAFVHTSRLQYLEFFGKFFEDGGVGFSPAGPSNEYSTVESDTSDTPESAETR